MLYNNKAAVFIEKKKYDEALVIGDVLKVLEFIAVLKKSQSSGWKVKNFHCKTNLTMQFNSMKNPYFKIMYNQ